MSVKRSPPADRNESTHHVPLMIVLPQATTGRKINEPVSIAQIAPTIYDFARVDWSEFSRKHPRYATSLLRSKRPALTSFSVPEPRTRSQESTREREELLRSLGYIQ